ncbi:PREDICTED: LRR receptor-like serine/threonine-protein kinase GSO2 [Nelumbo nucifera]|uniref:LRR receptor-like serine/threonine-protein kinase GSO2 n=2 Tax=Nelumbo nucifera TaxID=4432 RepID=A0A1U8ATY7_NELNU|nr:PREDICTED: LRR receptor-like serine/threonine-protein kinase GSO2 [Nelumbo nucifera]DAD36368.1 TPA_asm: hypothetical protein HUJ06_007009 [Nelumbo nucifera]
MLSGFPFLETVKPCSCDHSDNKVGCMEMERAALLDFKENLTDRCGDLSSWVGNDCCSWRGIRCNNRTGRVVQLDLGDPCQDGSWGLSSLVGEPLNPLLNLEHLNYLDLSTNNFGGIPIPNFIGSFKKLRYLNLSYAQFSGTIPSHLGNLSNLRHLDLSTRLFPFYKLNVNCLDWLLGMSSLEYLNMGSVDMSKLGTNWLQSINKLGSLKELKLGDCQLHSTPLSPPFVNLTSLLDLDLSFNSLNISILPFFLNVSSLVNLDFGYNRPKDPNLSVNLNIIDQSMPPKAKETLCRLQSLVLAGNRIGGEVDKLVDILVRCKRIKMLDLSFNQFNGSLPASIGNLSSLDSLDLSENQFTGPLPASIGNLSLLEKLDLSYNQINGAIPIKVGQLSGLVYLYLHDNSWEGVLSEHHFTNLTRLEALFISSSSGKSSLVFNVTNDWVPPFNLKYLVVSDLQLGPRFPSWLHTQNQLSSISLTNVGISDEIPTWFWKLLSKSVRLLNLSHNKLTGKVPNSSVLQQGSEVDLSFNRLEGQLPLRQFWSSPLRSLHLGNNLFSGPIPPDIGGNISLHLLLLDLSWNNLSGSIPPSITKIESLRLLILSNNQLSGELPWDWEDLQQLSIVDLANNSLTGTIPSSFSSLASLEWLILSNNSFNGELPSLKSCTSLMSLDLGENKFSGNLMTLIGETSAPLVFLRLRSNSFVGDIPKQLCHFSSLHFLDLAHNNLSGPIPLCFGNLSAFNGLWLPYAKRLRYQGYDQHMMIIAKGREVEYNTYGILDLVKSIDLSSNDLSGKIPDGITNLSGLGTLNFSMNQLTGNIPDKIGDLKWLETLDLSRNQLSGQIPQSLSSISSLNHLDLSYNNLSGRIPSGNQLQTLNDSSIYNGNPYLCGSPLSRKCEDDEKPSQGPTSLVNAGSEDKDSSDSEMQWFYISMLPGFVVGFWGVCGTLLLKKSWRHAYFNFLNDMKDWVFIVIALSVIRLQRKLKFGRV